MFISNQWVSKKCTIVSTIPEEPNTFYIKREGEYFSLNKITNIKVKGEDGKIYAREVILEISTQHSKITVAELEGIIKKEVGNASIFISKEEFQKFTGYKMQMKKIEEKERKKQSEKGIVIIEKLNKERPIAK